MKPFSPTVQSSAANRLDLLKNTGEAKNPAVDSEKKSTGRRNLGDRFHSVTSGFEAQGQTSRKMIGSKTKTAELSQSRAKEDQLSSKNASRKRAKKGKSRISHTLSRRDSAPSHNDNISQSAFEMKTLKSD